MRPTSATQLEIGDFFGVPLAGGTYACGQVVHVKCKGAGSRTAFVVGVVDWTGPNRPSQSDIEGKPVLDVGLTRIEVFTKDGAEVIGNTPVTGADRFDINFRDSYVGAVHKVWGWKALPKIFARVLDEA